eukprot:3642739-Ditylum_brightwellii.AAC.1
MDGPYIGYDEDENENIPEFSTVVSDLITVMNTHNSFVSSSQTAAVARANSSSDISTRHNKSKFD